VLQHENRPLYPDNLTSVLATLSNALDIILN
jgi:hypothetical protein